MNQVVTFSLRSLHLGVSLCITVSSRQTLALTELVFNLQQHKALVRRQEQEEDVKRLQEAKDREVTTASVEEDMKNKARYIWCIFCTNCSWTRNIFPILSRSPRTFGQPWPS